MLLLDPFSAVFYFKFGLHSLQFFLAYWFAEYLARLLLCLAALELIELALDGSRLGIAKPAFILSRLFVVVASGIVVISYYLPRLTNREGRFEFQLAIYVPSTLLVLLAWIAYGRRRRFELLPCMLIAAFGLTSAINIASLAMQQFALTVLGHQAGFVWNITRRASPVGALLLRALWLYAITFLGPPKTTEAREGEWIRAGDRPSALTVALARGKEET
jgi:hypothetical protein